MNKQFLFTILVVTSTVFTLNAQVQVDHSIQLTGTGANRQISGIKTVANGQDAVNDSSVQRDILKYAVATGLGTSASPYVVNLSPAPLAGYATGMMIYFQAPVACLAGPVYINVNGLGSQVIKENGSTDLAAADIGLNQLVAIQYDGTNFEMQSLLGNPPSQSLYTHYVGQLFGGGIIAAIWDSLGYERGLIVSLSDQSTGSAWSNVTSASSGATSLGNGTSNTAAIESQATASSGAAFVCTSYNGGGFTDWYLPSLGELQQVIAAACIINKVLGDANGLGFEISGPASVRYWSSTEVSTTNAYSASTQLGNASSAKSSATISVRAVRRY